MRLGQWFVLSKAFILVLAVIPAAYVSYSAWREYSKSINAGKALDTFALVLKAEEKVSAERGPSNGLMGSNLQDDPVWSVRLATGRSATDSAFDALDKNLAISPWRDIAAGRELIARIRSDLSGNRSVIDRIGNLPPDTRDAGEIRSAVSHMIALVTSLEPLISKIETRVGETDSDLITVSVVASRAGDLREFAGQLGSVFAAPLARTLPFVPDESLSLARLQERVNLLAEQLDQAVAGARIDSVSAAAAAMTSHFLKTALNLIERIGQAGRSDGHYPVTSNQFIEAYVPAMSTILQVRDAALVEAETIAETHKQAAHRTMVLAIGLMVFVSLMVAGLAWLQITRIIAPLTRLTGSLGAGMGETGLSVPETGRRDEIGELARAVEASKRNALEIDRLRDQAERALAEQRTIYDTSPNGIALIRNRIYVSCNRACEIIHGYEPGEMLGLSTRETFASREAFEEFGRRIYQMAERGGVATSEYVATKKSGETCWLRISLAAIPTGEPDAGYIAVIEDISERKRADDRLLETERWYRSILHLTPDGLIVIEEDGTIMLASRMAAEMFGYDPSEMLGLKVDRLVPDEYRGGHAALRHRFLDSGEVTVMGLNRSLQGQRRDGTRFDVEITLSRIANEAGSGFSVCASVRDTTERRRAQRALADAEERFRLILGSVREGIIGMDREGLVAFANSAGAEMLGYSEKELIGTLLHAKVHYAYPDGAPYPRESCPMFSSTHDGIPRSVSGEVMWRSDGSNFPVEYDTNPISKDGEFVGTVVAFRDITERLKAEERLKEAFDVIADSIRYASRIQKSVLPDEEAIRSNFSDFFLLWEPRDVVSGDVYWCIKWGESTLIALGDCTGHGVPGAIVTMIASGAFERARSEIAPGDVSGLVQRMHQIMQAMMRQHLETGESNDGIDLGLCAISDDRKLVTFVGARFSLFYTDSEGDIIEQKGSKRGLGYRGIPSDQAYDPIEISCHPNMVFWMSSDGLFDQIGGDRRRAFGKARFVDLINRNSDRPMAEYAVLLRDALETYQGDELRRDDISVLGFRLS